MKRFSTIGIGLAVLSISLVAWGLQSDHPDHSGGEPRHGAGFHHGPPPLDKMAKDLSLTDRQKTQIKAIFDDTGKQMDAIHNDESLSDAEKMTQGHALHESTHTKIQALLTDDQKKKWAAIEAKHKDGMRKHHENGDAPPPPPGQD